MFGAAAAGNIFQLVTTDACAGICLCPALGAESCPIAEGTCPGCSINCKEHMPGLQGHSARAWARSHCRTEHHPDGALRFVAELDCPAAMGALVSTRTELTGIVARAGCSGHSGRGRRCPAALGPAARSPTHSQPSVLGWHRALNRGRW